MFRTRNNGSGGLIRFIGVLYTLWCQEGACGGVGNCYQKPIKSLLHCVVDVLILNNFDTWAILVSNVVAYFSSADRHSVVS